MPDQSNAAGTAVHNSVACATITLPQASARTAREALFRDLEELLQNTAEQVSEFFTRPDGPDLPMPLAADVRPMFDWISEAVEALDALGWKAAAECQQAEAKAKPEREGEDR